MQIEQYSFYFYFIYSSITNFQNGYTVDVKNGQECIQDTFLKSPFDDAYYFSIYVALLFLIWVIVIIL